VSDVKLWKRLRVSHRLGALAAVGLLVASVVGLVSVFDTNSLSRKADSLYLHSTLTLNDLGHLNDVLGDARVEVHEYTDASGAADRASVLSDIKDTDAQMLQYIAAYNKTPAPQPAKP
jgi:Four helix bundle sensory module for signal transduction